MFSLIPIGGNWWLAPPPPTCILVASPAPITITSTGVAQLSTCKGWCMKLNSTRGSLRIPYTIIVCMYRVDSRVACCTKHVQSAMVGICSEQHLDVLSAAFVGETYTAGWYHQPCCREEEKCLPSFSQVTTSRDFSDPWIMSMRGLPKNPEQRGKERTFAFECVLNLIKIK